MTKQLKAKLHHVNLVKRLLLTLITASGVTAFIADAATPAEDIERVRTELTKMIPPAQNAEIHGVSGEFCLCVCIRRSCADRRVAQYQRAG